MEKDNNIHFNSHNSIDKEAIETLAAMNLSIDRVKDNMVIIATTAIKVAIKVGRTLGLDKEAMVSCCWMAKDIA